jgi:polar amino acid transport system substrate-binding protein
MIRTHMHTLPLPAFLVFFWLLCDCAYAEPIIVLNTTGKPPLNTPEQTGFMDKVAKEAFRRIGITLKTVQLPAERGLINANKGIEDGEMSRIAGLQETYPNLIQVPEKIMDWEFVVFSKQAIALDAGWDSLKNYTVAYMNGWKILERHVPESHSLKVSTPEQLFTMLKKNRTDLIIYERWGGLLYAKRFGLDNVITINPPLAVRAMFIYLNKRHKALVPKLAAAIKQLKNDGTYQRFYSDLLVPLTDHH